jgi:hypothetical protein
MSSDEPTGQYQQVVNQAPWGEQEPYLKKGFEAAEQNVLNKPINPYPNSAVVPFSNQTNTALGMMENRAMAGNAGNKAAMSNITDTLGGSYLNSNPYLNTAIDAATRPMVDRFNDTVLPGIQAGFQGSGRYGSGLQAYQQRQAGEDLTRSIGDVSGAMSYQNYGDERTNQMRAATMAPMLAQTEYDDIGALQNVGAIREGQAGAQMQDDINRYYAEQMAPRDAAKEYMAMIGSGSYGGTTQNTQPIYSNNVATGLGYAGSAAGIAGGLFGGGNDSAWNGMKGLFPS